MNARDSAALLAAACAADIDVMVRCPFRTERTQLYRFFDKDDSDSVDLEEIEKTLDWGRKRESMRPLLAGWRQVALSVGDTDT